MSCPVLCRADTGLKITRGAAVMSFDDDLVGRASGFVQVMQIAAAHARGLHADHNLIRSRHGIGKIAKLKLSFTKEYDGFHVWLLGVQAMVWPPSTTMADPMAKPACCEHSQRTAEAISSG